jgi:outer membrane protein insertion porin family
MRVGDAIEAARRALRRCGLALALAAALAVPALAQQGDRVSEIIVQGNQRIEAETVRSYMAIVPGDRFDDERIDRSLKTLFGTGYFRDVTMRRQGNALVVSVVENPIINRLAFEGNRRISDETLQREVQLKPRQVYTPASVQRDLQRILQIYRRSGRFAATVEPKVIQQPQNRVDLIFEINEGPLTTVDRIRFVGNRRFSDARLREEILTKESAWYRFLSTDDTYDPDRLTEDRAQLRRFYLSRGYADFRVVSAVAELMPSREAFFITFSVEEGEQYKFGKIDLRSEIKAVDVERLRALITTKQGTTYDAEAIEKIIQELTFELGRQGYAFVDVRPDVNKNAEKREIDLTYVVNESPRVYVERVNISGNVRTLDRVIRREIRLAEGDAFNTAKLRRSRVRLRGLNFFEKVEIKEQRGSTPDKVVIDVEVQEKSTGELTFGAGYSTADSILGDVSLRERNLLGRGQDLRLGLVLSPRRQQFDLGFTEPYFLDRELAAGFDLFRRRLDLQRRSGYDQDSSGGALRASFPITEELSQQVYYRLRHDRIENVDSSASRFIRDQAGGSVTSLVGYILAYDRRDDRIEPTKGYILRGGQDFAGLGGTERFVRNTIGGTHYFPVAEKVVLSLGADAGYLFGIGKDVSINNRFFLGGDSLRGFEAGGIGPRDIVTADALGGNIYYKGTAELEFPLGLPNEFGIKGRVFTEAGSLFTVDESGPEVVDSGSLRVSSGVGLSWRTPFGPIRLDLGFPIIKESYDQEELFRFSFGTRF